MKNSFLQKNRWLIFVTSRFAKVDRKGRTAVTSVFASAGIACGVMALIIVMSVMNGFQMSFVDSILEISSLHARIENIENGEKFIEWAQSDSDVRSVYPYYEEKGLMVQKNGNQSAAIVRAVPRDMFYKDMGFQKELNMVSGEFDLSEKNYIVMGNTLARNLGLRVGSNVNIAALGGSSDTALFSSNRVFEVKGIFYCGYADINSSYSFIGIENSSEYFGNNAQLYYGVKFQKPSMDSVFLAKVKQAFPESTGKSYREFNRTFFGVLKMEKNMIFFLVFLIFIVVSLNIFNSMFKLVLERKEEISVLSALGGTSSQIRMIFLLRGLFTGAGGSVPGVILGVVISKNMDSIFMGLSHIFHNNPMFAIYASIPPRIYAGETLLIFLFGLFASVGASWFASASVLKMNVSEIMRNE